MAWPPLPCILLDPFFKDKYNIGERKKKAPRLAKGTQRFKIGKKISKGPRGGGREGRHTDKTDRQTDRGRVKSASKNLVWV